MKTLSYQFFLVLTVSMLTLCLGPAVLGQTYTITDLGTLGGSYSHGFGINASGEVTGVSSLSGESASHAFRYSGGAMTDLGTLGGGNVSRGNDINRSGQVTGYSFTTGGRPHVFLYSAGSMTDLGTLGGSDGIGQSINDSGQIAGFSFTRGNSAYHGFLYSGGVMTDLGTLGGDSSQGYGVNASGQVTGTSATADSRTADAFLYSGTAMSDLGTLGGTVSVGQAINASGEITGYSLTRGNIENHAFLYIRGTMNDLGTLGGTFSVGQAINASGQVTGTSSFISGNTAQHAFLYASATGMVDLNTLLPANSGWTLIQAQAINDFGQITGSGINPDGHLHAYLLSPASTADLSIRMGGAMAVKFGGDLRYVIVVQNTGPQAANNVVVSDTLPVGAIRVVNLPKSCRLANGTNTLTCNLGNIEVGGGTTIHFMLQDVNFANVGSRLINTATVSGAVRDPNPANNTSTRTSVIK